MKPDTLLSVKTIEDSLLLELTCGLLDSLHDNFQGQTWDLHISLVDQDQSQIWLK